MVIIFVLITFLAIAIVVPIINKAIKAKRVDQMVSQHSFGLSFSFPLDYLFSDNHMWMNKESGNSYKVGMDEILERFVGEPDQIFLMNSGDKVKKGDQIAVIKKGNKELYVKSPITGEIETVNQSISDNPSEISKNPYQTGWFYQIKSFDKIEKSSMVRTKLKAKYWLTEELNRLKDFVSVNLPQPVAIGGTLLDGGELTSGLIDHLDQKSINMFEEQFLGN